MKIIVILFSDDLRCSYKVSWISYIPHLMLAYCKFISVDSLWFHEALIGENIS